jgi:hypothetical protein
MITLKYKNLLDDRFVLALQALKVTRFRDFKSPRNCLKIIREIESEMEVVRKLYGEEFGKYLEKTEQGHLIPQKGQYSPFKLKEGVEEEYKTKFEEFKEVEFNIETEKINGDMILEARLSPVMIGALEPIFE